MPTRQPAQLDRPLIAAAMLGLSAGMRTFAPPVALAVRQRKPFRGPARLAAFAGGAAEIVADKLPKTGSRWAPGPVAGRIVSASIGGRELDGWKGAGVAALASVAAAYTGARLRTSVRGRAAQLVAAVAEDALCYGLALAAVSENR
jgi:hypothetical protein